MSNFQLIDPDYVAKCLAEPHAAKNWKVLEAHFTSIDHPLDPDLPNKHHIPGAIQMHPSYLEAGTNRSKYYPFYEHPSDGDLLPDRELTSALARLGITPDTPIIVYGTEPEGTMAAARVVWGLLYAGVKCVRLLDGGIDAWISSGRDPSKEIELASSIAQLTSAPDAPWGMRPEFLATTDDVRRISKNPSAARAKLVDVRKAGEWDGTLTDYYDFFSKAGHIPNAHFQGDWNNLLDMASHKIAPKIASVAQRWRAQDIIDADVERGRTELVFYCGTGWRSSISFLVAQLLGLRAKNYDSGFYGWSWNGENEIATTSKIAP